MSMFSTNPSAMMTKFYQRDVWQRHRCDGSKTVLLNRRMHLQSEMMKVANQTKQPVSLEINNEGEIKTLSDGKPVQGHKIWLEKL